MAPPVYTPGQVLAASDVNNWFLPIAAYKTADLARSTNTTLTPDPDLVMTIAVSCFYRFQCELAFNGSATASQGFRWNFTVPTGTTVRYHLVCIDQSGATQVAGSWTGSSTNIANTTGTGNPRALSMNGTVFTGVNAGNMVLQWSQAVSEATAVTLSAQSYMTLDRIG